MTKRTILAFEMEGGSISIIAETIEAILQEGDGCVLVTHNDVYKLKQTYNYVVNKVFGNDTR